MAIAFDAAVSGGNNGGSTNNLSWSHTCSGSNLVLFVCFEGDSTANDITGVTYNGVAMTALFSPSKTGSDRYYYAYYLFAPATGANTVTISASSSHYLFGVSASYTGVAQSGMPDASATNSQAQGGSGTLTTSLTTVAANCWTLLFAAHDGNGGAPTAGTGSTRRALSDFNANAIFDSNTALTAGSNSMTVTWATPVNAGIGVEMWSIAPAGAAPSTTYPGYQGRRGWF